eukprot:s5591_g2.t1
MNPHPLSWRLPCRDRRHRRQDEARQDRCAANVVQVLKGHQPCTDSGHRSAQQRGQHRLSASIVSARQHGGKEVVLVFHAEIPPFSIGK